MKAFKKIASKFFSEDQKKNKPNSKGMSDILVIQHQNGEIHSTPFIAFFGQQHAQSIISVKINQKFVNCPPFQVNLKGYLQPQQPSKQFWNQVKLKYGCNQIVFTIKQETKQIRGEIFLYSQEDRFVISDMDGTMTKTDLGGLINNFSNKHFLHDGYQELIQRVSSNGYKIIFITMRPFLLYKMTKNYLKTYIATDSILIMQNSQVVESMAKQLLNLGARYKDITVKLLRGLFPVGTNPFYGAFGNKKGDQLVYDKAGIQSDRIFIINEQSVVFCRFNKQMSYKDIQNKIDIFFPQKILDYQAWQQKVWKTRMLTNRHTQKKTQ